jgi:signal transduction histidine kinase
MGAVVLLLSYPLATTIVDQARTGMFIERRNDTARLASLAAAGDEAALDHLLHRYVDDQNMEGIVLARNGEVVLSSRNPPPTFSHEEWEHISRALNGYRNTEPVVDAPWGTAPMIIAEPVIREGVAVGAVVTLSSTGDLRTNLVVKLAILLLCQLAVVVVCIHAALRLTNWVLRPVGTLGRLTQAMANGRLDLRISEDHGPPELQRLITSFNSMADNVRTALEQQSAFVADASHQLRNPLSALLLRLDLAATNLPAESGQALEDVREEARRLAVLLDSMLALATARGDAHEPETVELSWLVNERIATWSAVARHKNIQLTSQLSGAGTVTADPYTLASALDAVLDNAVKFTPAGGSVGVSLVNSTSDAMTGIRVADNGPGLSAHELGRVGDRFWRSPRHQNVDGSGLGLAIVRRLLHEASGRLDVGLNPPHGLVVTLWLPRQPTPATNMLDERGGCVHQDATPSGPGLLLGPATTPQPLRPAAPPRQPESRDRGTRR